MPIPDIAPQYLETIARGRIQKALQKEQLAHQRSERNRQFGFDVANTFIKSGIGAAVDFGKQAVQQQHVMDLEYAKTGPAPGPPPTEAVAPPPVAPAPTPAPVATAPVTTAPVAPVPTAPAPVARPTKLGVVPPWKEPPAPKRPKGMSDYRWKETQVAHGYYVKRLRAERIQKIQEAATLQQLSQAEQTQLYQRYIESLKSKKAVAALVQESHGNMVWGSGIPKRSKLGDVVYESLVDMHRIHSFRMENGRVVPIEESVVRQRVETLLGPIRDEDWTMATKYGYDNAIAVKVTAANRKGLEEAWKRAFKYAKARKYTPSAKSPKEVKWKIPGVKTEFKPDVASDLGANQKQLKAIHAGLIKEGYTKEAADAQLAAFLERRTKGYSNDIATRNQLSEWLNDSDRTTFRKVLGQLQAKATGGRSAQVGAAKDAAKVETGTVTLDKSGARKQVIKALGSKPFALIKGKEVNEKIRDAWIGTNPGKNIVIDGVDTGIKKDEISANKPGGREGIFNQKKALRAGKRQVFMDRLKNQAADFKTGSLGMLKQGGAAWTEEEKYNFLRSQYGDIRRFIKSFKQWKQVMGFHPSTAGAGKQGLLNEFYADSMQARKVINSKRDTKVSRARAYRTFINRRLKKLREDLGGDQAGLPSVEQMQA